MATPEELPSADERVRLQKYLASCGLGSRRACEEFISAGRVTIDGVVAETLGVSVNPKEQVITLDGERLRRERRKYYMLHKPPGFLCTNHDPEGRPRVIDLFPKGGPRLFTVGRLDEDSEGLLIVTNDGDLAQKLAHPKFQIFRTYQVQVAGNPTAETLEQLQQGMYFTEGKFRVRGIKTLKKQGKSTHLEIVLGEGQNREIRRLLARVGHKVMSLKRVAYGPLKLGSLSKGRARELTREELASLHELLERITGEASTIVPALRSRGGRSPRDAKSAGRTRSGSRPVTGPRSGNKSIGGKTVGSKSTGGRSVGGKSIGGKSVGGKSVGSRAGSDPAAEVRGPKRPATRPPQKPFVPEETTRVASAEDDFIVRKAPRPAGGAIRKTPTGGTGPRATNAKTGTPQAGGTRSGRPRPGAAKSATGAKPVGGATGAAGKKKKASSAKSSRKGEVRRPAKSGDQDAGHSRRPTGSSGKGPNTGPTSGPKRSGKPRRP
ncbi:MAG: pseudouridine synthase [Planctomycetaceae bacterium]